jgi:hypothetical protein
MGWRVLASCCGKVETICRSQKIIAGSASRKSQVKRRNHIGTSFLCRKNVAVPLFEKTWRKGNANMINFLVER